MSRSPFTRSANFINKADHDRASFAAEQSKRMMGAGNSLTGKDNRTAGSSLCPTCGDQHKLGTVCHEMAKADNPTMPGKKVGTPHVAPQGASGNPFHNPGDGKFAPRAGGVSGPALNQPGMTGHQGGGSGGMPTAPGMPKQSGPSHFMPGVGGPQAGANQPTMVGTPPGGDLYQNRPPPPVMPQGGPQQPTGQYASPGMGQAPINVGPPPQQSVPLHSNDPRVQGAASAGQLPHNWPPVDAKMTAMGPGGVAGMSGQPGTAPVATMSDEERQNLIRQFESRQAAGVSTAGSAPTTMPPTSAGRAVPGMTSAPPQAPTMVGPHPGGSTAPPAQPPPQAPQPAMPHPNMSPAPLPSATPPAPGTAPAPPQAQGTKPGEKSKVQFGPGFSQGESIGAGMDRPGGSARPTANMAAGRAHEMLNWKPQQPAKPPQAANVAQKSLLEMWLDKYV